MIPLELDTIADLCNGALVRRPGSSLVTGVTADSRCVTSGDLFVAVGRGRSYVEEAMAAGAAGMRGQLAISAPPRREIFNTSRAGFTRTLS